VGANTSVNAGELNSDTMQVQTMILQKDPKSGHLIQLPVERHQRAVVDSIDRLSSEAKHHISALKEGTREQLVRAMERHKDQVALFDNLADYGKGVEDISLLEFIWSSVKSPPEWKFTLAEQVRAIEEEYHSVLSLEHNPDEIDVDLLDALHKKYAGRQNQDALLNYIQLQLANAQLLHTLLHQINTESSDNLSYWREALEAFRQDTGNLENLEEVGGLVNTSEKIKDSQIFASIILRKILPLFATYGEENLLDMKDEVIRELEFSLTFARHAIKVALAD
jgi:hypothetical protein